jgi:2-hydroxychromene-2-carboxylate isomerase
MTLPIYPDIADPLTSDRPLIVYLDFKSPYAYLAWAPARDLARRLGVAVDWRPFVLDIPSYLGSARLDSTGRVAEQQRSAEQWSGVKYAYFDCRRYANLRGLTVRGTVKIWDTSLAAVGLLWARRQGDAVVERYIDGMFEPFWRRALDVEDPAVITALLAAAGADTAGFAEFAAGAGAQANADLQQAAFAAGVFGVPTFVVAGQRYFGREHLPRVAWHLTGEQGPAPDVAYEAYEADVAHAAAGDSAAGPNANLDVVVDLLDPHCYLALTGTRTLAEEAAAAGACVRWRPLRGRPLRAPWPEAPDEDRGARHRRLRAQYLADDLARYAPHPLRDPHAAVDGTLAAMALLWVQQSAGAAAAGAFAAAALIRYWGEGLELDATGVAALLLPLGLDAAGFEGFAAGPGPAALADAEAEVRQRGISTAPAWVLEEEPFIGRQHLPLLRARLTRWT